MKQRLMMALLGAAAGLSLYLLFRAIDEGLLADRLAVAASVFAGAFFTGVLVMTGPVPLRRSAAGAALVALVTAALFNWAGLRFDQIGDFAATSIPIISVIVLSLVPLPFLMAAGRPGWRNYPALFTGAWGIFMRASVAWIFVGIVWGVIYLSDALFGIVGLRVIQTILDVAVMPWLITGTVLGLALAVVLELSDVVTPYLVLRLLRLLLPVVLVVLVVFIIALPVKGASGLFGLPVSAVLLTMAGVAATLVTSAVDQHDKDATRLPLMRRATQALALILPVPAVIAAWSLAIRVAAEGWTPGRLFGATAAAMALGYGLLYALAVLRGAGWMARIRRANVAMALLLLAVAALWLTPVLNPERISAASQLARFESGKVSAAELDIHAVESWGRAGAAAMARLNELAKAGDGALAARLAGTETPPAEAPADLAKLRADLTLDMPVQPASAAPMRQRIVDLADSAELSYWQSLCTTPMPGGEPGCVLVVADFLPETEGEEALLVLRGSDGYLTYLGLSLVDGLLQQHSVQSSTGVLANEEQGAALIAALQKTPPVLSPVPQNQIAAPAGGSLTLSP